MSNKNIGQKRKLEHWELVTLLLMVYDFLAIGLSYFAALWVRFDCRYNSIQKEFLNAYYRTIVIYAVFCVVVFWFLRLYKSIWRFASYAELLRIILATAITGVVYMIAMFEFVYRMPISYFVFGIVFQFCLTLGIRFAYRFILLLRGRRREEAGYKKRVMLVGAGAAGQMIFRDIKQSKETNEKVYCFIDDNSNKWGRYIDDVPVFGGRENIMEAVAKFGIEKIYVAIPSADAKERREILRICNETQCELLNLPGMYQLYRGEVSVSKMKPVQIEELLGRDPIKTNMNEVFQYITGKVVLVTGVGSIGSELARQIAAHNPKHLILFDIYENNAYDIQQELRKKYPNLNLDTIIGSVRDSRKIFQVFEKYQPEIVYHAAAHKHVPLMEDSPCEAIKNNAMGTYKTAYAAMSHGCKRFVLISTDKAVNPTNIMGASKRLCEMIIQAFDSKIKEGKADEIPQLFTHGMADMITAPKILESLKTTQTEFVAVRFGNVLGSAGSVIPLFKRQMANGGPVTVTDKRIIRYFMTIPEASQLVLQSGAIANNGELFVLDMGQPVKIMDLAENMIRLSGVQGIEIIETGLRPGEKLYEELLVKTEELDKTDNSMIFIERDTALNKEEIYKKIKVLRDACDTGDDLIAKEALRSVVPTFKTPEEVNKEIA